MEHPNVAMARAAYSAFAQGDLEKVAAVWANDIIWHVNGNSPLAGEYKGQEEIFGFFGRLFELSGGTLELDVHDILANDDHITVLVTMNAERNGQRLEMRSVHVMQLEQGLMREFWSFEEDPVTDDAFWS
jgi:uncharacterized protein